MLFVRSLMKPNTHTPPTHPPPYSSIYHTRTTERRIQTRQHQQRLGETENEAAVTWTVPCPPSKRCPADTPTFHRKHRECWRKANRQLIPQTAVDWTTIFDGATPPRNRPIDSLRPHILCIHCATTVEPTGLTCRSFRAPPHKISTIPVNHQAPKKY